MISDLVFRLQLVSSSGVSIAEVPEGDVTESQLTSGIMSAMMAFSRETYNQEIKSLSYPDMTIVFVNFSDFFVIIELSPLLEKNVLDLFLKTFEEKSLPIFSSLNLGEVVETNETQQLLQSIYDSDWFAESLENVARKRPLNDAKVSTLSINLSAELSDYPNNIQQEIAFMIHTHHQIRDDQTKIQTGFVKSPTSDNYSYVFSVLEDRNIEVGMLTVGEGKAKTLFRLTPLLDRIVQSRLVENQRDFVQVLDDLTKTIGIDPHDRLRAVRGSPNLKTMEKKIKNVDKVLFSVVIGDQVLICTDGEGIREVMEPLLVFNQHLISDIEYNQISEEIQADVIGIQRSYYDQLVEKGILGVDGDRIIVSLETKKVTGKAKGNKYMKNLYDRVKNLTFQQASELVEKELDLLVSYAITATSYAAYNKKEALENLNGLKSSISDSNQFEIIKQLAIRQNYWLHERVYDDSFDESWI